MFVVETFLNEKKNNKKQITKSNTVEVIEHFSCSITKFPELITFARKVKAPIIYQSIFSNPQM